MDGRTRCYYYIFCLLTLTTRGRGAAVRPVVTFTPNWNELIYQDPVTITCDVGSAVPENQRYYWYKDGEIIDTDEKSFKIDYVREEDVGDYQCGTNTSHLSPPVTLRARQEYLILQRPPVIYVGDPLTLRCHSPSRYNSTNTTFYKDDKEIRFSVNDSELHIDTVDGGSSGTYRCTKLIIHESDNKYHCYSAETYISVSGKSIVKNLIHNIIIIGDTIGTAVIVIIIIIFIIFWRRRNKISSSTYEEQAESTSMAADTHPAYPEEDICYTYLSLDRLRSG
ncbi:low affinity immunoglobulin gamma Fc region receptor III-B-like [Leptodactylus fuscus]|uniref:low affinity immunoglobulin gamma Fc region receptor III-B-like n=1 Tax=Leptodactylus fuscus TaxID=238119 RepID=UPI003F4E87AD